MSAERQMSPSGITVGTSAPAAARLKDWLRPSRGLILKVERERDNLNGTSCKAHAAAQLCRAASAPATRRMLLLSAISIRATVRGLCATERLWLCATERR